MLPILLCAVCFTSIAHALPYIDQSFVAALAKSREFHGIDNLRKDTNEERTLRHRSLHDESRKPKSAPKGARKDAPKGVHIFYVRSAHHKKRAKFGPSNKWHDVNYYPPGNGICDSCKPPPSNPCPPEFSCCCCSHPCCSPAPVDVKPPPPPKKVKPPTQPPTK